MTKKIIFNSWDKPGSKIEFTLPDWLENFLVCEICYHSNSFYCDYPGEDEKDHVHYFTKLMTHEIKKELKIAN